MKYKIGTFLKATETMSFFKEGEIGFIIDTGEDIFDGKIYTICFFKGFSGRHNAMGLTQDGHGYYGRELMIDQYFTTDIPVDELIVLNQRFIDSFRPGDRIQAVYDDKNWKTGDKGTVIEKCPRGIIIHFDNDEYNYTIVHHPLNRIVPVVEENYNGGRRPFGGMLHIVTDWRMDETPKRARIFIDSIGSYCLTGKDRTAIAEKDRYNSIFDFTKEKFKSYICKK